MYEYEIHVRYNMGADAPVIWGPFGPDSAREVVLVLAARPDVQSCRIVEVKRRAQD